MQDFENISTMIILTPGESASTTPCDLQYSIAKWLRCHHSKDLDFLRCHRLRLDELSRNEGCGQQRCPRTYTYLLLRDMSVVDELELDSLRHRWSLNDVIQIQQAGVDEKGKVQRNQQHLQGLCLWKLSKRGNHHAPLVKKRQWLLGSVKGVCQCVKDA
ncbi:hypothetical protein EI94DRAFT_1011522 [Lactarius quietus]|nr:hypothetical protein EI94DRAFT_1011522 [Lactarius quietus]